MKTKLTQKQIRFQALLLFFITFFLVELCAGFLYQNQLKEAKLKADYTAQTTIGRVKSQLNHYLAESNLMKHMIEAGYTVDDEEFSVLSSLMQDDQNVIKAHELAKDGIVTLIYPMRGNEAALGLNTLENPAQTAGGTLLPKRAVSTPSQDHLNCSRAASAHCFLTRSTQPMTVETRPSGAFRFSFSTGNPFWMKSN